MSRNCLYANSLADLIFWRINLEVILLFKYKPTFFFDFDIHFAKHKHCSLVRNSLMWITLENANIFCKNNQIFNEEKTGYI